MADELTILTRKLEGRLMVLTSLMQGINLAKDDHLSRGLMEIANTLGTIDLNLEEIKELLRRPH